MKTKIFDLTKQYEEGIRTAAGAITNGRLVVIPTETVYGLGANALDAAAVSHIFEVKGRPQDNPLIVHIAEYTQAWVAAREISPMAQKLMRAFWPGPFTAVLKKSGVIPDVVSAGLDTVGIRLPDFAAARDLIKYSGCMIAAPSANLSGKPSPTKAEHVMDDLMGKVPVILDGGETDYGVESTVCDLTGEVPIVLRPGGITAEMIAAVAGRVEISPAVLNGLAQDECAPSPGMKYKHYSPRADVRIVEGENAQTIAFSMSLLYDRDKKMGKRPLLLCSDEVYSLIEGRNARRIGSSARQMAHRLFDELRHADSEHVDTIYFQATDTAGMGLAVMNRAIRAAGFKVISAEQI